MLERVHIEDLKVGDKILIAYESRPTWKCFRYPKFSKVEVVARITPKKTKLVTESGAECDRHTPLYLPTEEALRQIR